VSKGSDWYDYSVKPPRLVRAGNDPLAVHLTLPRTLAARQKSAALKALKTLVVTTDTQDEDFSVADLMDA
jgi:hypothetical protein